MLQFSPDMDYYTDKIFEQGKDSLSESESFKTCLPRYQRPLVVEAALLHGFPIYVVDNAAGPSGRILDRFVEIHCSDPDFNMNIFWEIFDELKQKTESKRK